MAFSASGCLDGAIGLDIGLQSKEDDQDDHAEYLCLRRDYPGESACGPPDYPTCGLIINMISSGAITETRRP